MLILLCVRVMATLIRQSIGFIFAQLFPHRIAIIHKHDTRRYDDTATCTRHTAEKHFRVEKKDEKKTPETSQRIKKGSLRELTAYGTHTLVENQHRTEASHRHTRTHGHKHDTRTHARITTTSPAFAQRLICVTCTPQPSLLLCPTTWLSPKESTNAHIVYKVQTN